MQLVINTYGSYLKKNGDCFLVKNDDKISEVSIKKIDSIMIATSAYVSTDALQFAVENNIDVIFLDKYGNPYGRVWHSKLGSTTLIRRRQLEVSDENEGLELTKGWVLRKIENQMDFLERLKRPREEKAGKLEESLRGLTEIKQKIASLSGTLEDRRGTVMAFEGMAGKMYFEALSYIMPDRFRFDGRSRNPAKDEFNALLNYAYGVLYSLVEKACIIAGLDPYIGFLHTDDYNKKSLVFDLIEMFRIFADEPVVYLFSGRKVKVEFFDEIKGGFTLNRDGKAVLIEALNSNLDEAVRYRGRNIQRRNIIQLECHSIANSLIKETKDADMDSVEDRQEENVDYLRKRIGCIEKKVGVYLASGKYHIKGIVDEVLTLSDGTMAPLDYKYAEYKGTVFKNHHYQAVFYGLLIKENYGRDVNRGFICYTRSRNHLEEISITGTDFDNLHAVIKEILDITQRCYYPKGTLCEKQCEDCCYRRICV
ncbi:MAG: CRISPR-associated endonuclease Cas1 [Nitrospirae bacterium]|nr:CRISPR-associated endonuclease Cas1 [Nitrospirota bacterium]